MSRLRSSLAIAATLIGSIGTIYAIAASILLHSFMEVEQQNAQRDVDQVVNFINLRAQELENDLSDYASWDATYEFIENQNPTYLVEGFTDIAMTDNQLNIAAILNNEGRCLFCLRFDLRSKQSSPLPTSLLPHLRAGQLLLSQTQASRVRSGLMSTPEGVLSIGSHAILRSNQQGPSRGNFVFGQYFGVDEIARLNHLTQLKVALTVAATRATQPDFEETYKILSRGEKIVIRRVDAQTLVASRLLSDIYGKPSILLQVTIPRSTYQQGLMSLRYLGASLLVVGIGLGYVIYGLTQRLVMKMRESDRLSQSLEKETALRQTQEQYREKAIALEKALCQLQKAQAQLVQSEKMSSLGQLVAGVAHEINNPANFIYGNLIHLQHHFKDLMAFVAHYQTQRQDQAGLDAIAQKIDLEFLATDFPKLSRSLQTGAERIQQIVLSLRNFSRLDESDMKVVNLHEGIDNALMIVDHRLRAQGKFPGIMVLKDYGDLPAIECYPGQLNQAIMNLLVNAIDVLEKTWMDAVAAPDCPQEMVAVADQIKGHKRFSRGEVLPMLGGALKNQFTPRLYIRTSLISEAEVMIRIADNGTGIPEAIQSKLFDPFFTTKPVGQGTGLGLAICYQVIVEKHGGAIACESAAGQGAEFIVRLPVMR